LPRAASDVPLGFGSRDAQLQRERAGTLAGEGGKVDHLAELSLVERDLVGWLFSIRC
jgi:hypothetical protein